MYKGSRRYIIARAEYDQSANAHALGADRIGRRAAQCTVNSSLALNRLILLEIIDTRDNSTWPARVHSSAGNALEY